MHGLTSFIQSLLLYALTSNTSIAFRHDVSNRKSSVSHDISSTDTQNVFPDRTQYFNFLLELTQSPERDLRRPNLRRLTFGSWVKWKTASQKFKSKHVRPYFPRAPRARLDRMPLAFGKRAESERKQHENSDEFDREARNRINRMPLTFGKRSPDKLNQDSISTSEVGDVVATPKVYSLDQISSIGNEGSFLKRHSNRLTRMPITFGKRTQTAMEHYLRGNPVREGGDSSGNEVLQEKSFSREGRTSLSRMPLTFGRKKKTTGSGRQSLRRKANLGNSLASHNDIRESLLINLVGKLASATADGPPVSSLTDAQSDSHSMSNGALENDVILSGTSPERKLGIPKNDDMSRDPNGQSISDDIYSYDAFPVKRRTVINRMPLTFGKREGPAPDRYGYGREALEADRTSTDQVKDWLSDGHGDEDESDAGRRRNRSPDNRSRMITDRDDWVDAL